MPKWISVEEAAAKYGINKEVIWLWADMKRFPMSYEKGITTVDEESLIGFLKLLAVKTKNSCIKGSK